MTLGSNHGNHNKHRQVYIGHLSQMCSWPSHRSGLGHKSGVASCRDRRFLLYAHPASKGACSLLCCLHLESVHEHIQQSIYQDRQHQHDQTFCLGMSPVSGTPEINNMGLPPATSLRGDVIGTLRHLGPGLCRCLAEQQLTSTFDSQAHRLKSSDGELVQLEAQSLGQADQLGYTVV